MTRIGYLLERLRGAPIDGERFRICTTLGPSFLARSPSGRAALLVPCGEGGSALGRVSGAILLAFSNNVAFEVDGTSWNSAAVVLECMDETVLHTFVALAIDVADQLGEVERPRPDQVLRAVACWERLLRSHAVLSEERQVGLWGELAFILDSPSVDGAVRAWNPDPDGIIDFIGGAIGVEVKTSTTRLRHSMSKRQGDAVDGDLRVLFASTWVVPDPVGRSLVSMVAAVADSTAETVAFEQKVLAAGFSRRDADSYSRRFSKGASTLVFEGSRLPRIREVDPGISGVRYIVDLDAAEALDASDVAGAVATLCGTTGP